MSLKLLKKFPNEAEIFFKNQKILPEFQHFLVFGEIVWSTSLGGSRSYTETELGARKWSNSLTEIKMAPKLDK